VREKPVGIRAIGVSFGWTVSFELVDGGVGGVVMCLIISWDFLCQSLIVVKYSVNRSGESLEPPSVMVVSADATLVAFVAGVGPLQVFMTQEVSFSKLSLMYLPTSACSSLSEPSIAIAAPRVSIAGLEALGAANAGDIFASTLTLLTKGIVMTIASTLFA
jgi:hypothetical protein